VALFVASRPNVWQARPTDFQTGVKIRLRSNIRVPTDTHFDVDRTVSAALGAPLHDEAGKARLPHLGNEPAVASAVWLVRCRGRTVAFERHQHAQLSVFADSVFCHFPENVSQKSLGTRDCSSLREKEIFVV
jgi:hypothetical protein